MSTLNPYEPPAAKPVQKTSFQLALEAKAVKQSAKKSSKKETK